MSGSAVGALGARNSRFAIALASDFVAFVADAAVRVALAPAALAVRRVAIVTVVAELTTVAAVTARTRARHDAAAAAAGQPTAIRMVVLGRRTGTRPASARPVRVAIETSGARLASVASRIISATLFNEKLLTI